MFVKDQITCYQLISSDSYLKYLYITVLHYTLDFTILEK